MTAIISQVSDYLRSFLYPAGLFRLALAAGILGGLYFLSTLDYLLFHSVIEIVTIVIAFSIFILVWNTRRVIADTFFLIIGISFLFTGSIDLIHTLAYKGMGVFPGSTADLPTQLWIAARYFQSVTFFIAALFIGKSITKDRKYDTAIIFAACAAACAFLLASIFVWQNFPHCYIEGSGLTPFKIASEYVISLIFIATIIVIWIKRRHFDREVWQFLVAAQFFLIVGELAFTSYVSVYGFMNMIGHLAKLVSFYFFYRAIVVVGLTRPYDLLSREITEKDAALKKSEERCSVTFNALNDALWDWDIPAGTTFISDHFYTMLGYQPGEFPASYDSWKALVHTEDIGPVERKLQDHTKTGAGFSHEFRMRMKSGDWRWVGARGMVVEKDAKGTPIRMVGTLSDITERKRAQEALNESREMYRDLVENLNDVIFSLDLKGNFTYISPVVERLYGYSPSEMSGQHFSKYVHPDDQHPGIDAFEKRLKGEYGLNEYKIIPKDGRVEHVIVSQRPLIKDGAVIGFNYILTNITARKQAEDAVQAAVKLNQLIDTMSVSESMGYTLDEAERLTGSKIGFFHFINPDEKTIELIAWSTETKKRCFIPKEPQRHYPVEKAGVWVDCIRERRPVIHNDYASLPHKKGLPEGHVPLTRELVVPIFDEDRIVAIIGVGNKVTDYQEKDISVLALLAKNAWTLIQRKRAEQDLKVSEYRFRELFNSMSSGVAVYRAIDDGTDFVFVDFNHGAEIIEGVTKEDVIGKRVREVFSGVHEFGIMDVFRRVWRTGNAEYHPLTLYRDNRIASWRENFVYRLPSGEIVAVYDDISERKQAEEERERIRMWQAGVNRILESVLAPVPLDEKLKVITDGVVETFGADFCRIWLIEKGDLCDTGCMHAEAAEEQHACRYRDTCLHLKASSGRYTHIDGKAHRRVPFGAYKIGRIASGEETKFLTNDVVHDPRVHDHEWAKSLGLVSFSGYRLKPPDGDVLGVFALFATFPISPDMDAILDGLSRAISLAIQKDLADTAVRESEQKFRDIFNNTTDAIHIHGIRDDGSPDRFTDVNDVACRMLGYTREEMLEKTPIDITTGYHNPPVEKVFEEQRTFGGARFETEHRAKDGTIIPVEVNTHVVTIQGRNVILGVVRDITERKKTETLLKRFSEELEQKVQARTEELNASLDEKVLLLREIHHRVKNNLQIIISLTNLQMRQIDDERLKQVMAETQNRVRAMSFVHEKLYQSEDISRIDLASYTRFLVSHLFSFYGVNTRQVALNIDIGKIMLNINTAIPLGLIINELVSNTLKHAFPDGRTGTLSIAVREDERRLFLTLSDDGAGLPAGFDWRHAESLGLRLVISLVGQLDGTIELDRSAGTAFVIVVQEKE